MRLRVCAKSDAMYSVTLETVQVRSIPFLRLHRVTGTNVSEKKICCRSHRQLSMKHLVDNYRLHQSKENKVTLYVKEM